MLISISAPDACSILAVPCAADIATGVLTCIGTGLATPISGGPPDRVTLLKLALGIEILPLSFALPLNFILGGFFHAMYAARKVHDATALICVDPGSP